LRKPAAAYPPTATHIPAARHSRVRLPPAWAGSRAGPVWERAGAGGRAAGCRGAWLRGRPVAAGQRAAASRDARHRCRPAGDRPDGPRSRYFDGTWLSNMFPGSITWSSMLI